MNLNNITSEINELLNNINSKKNISININMDKNIIDNKFKILENLIKNKPINIKLYEKNLIKIKSKTTCNLCKRTALYQIQYQDKEKYCWIHSQNINLI